MSDESNASELNEVDPETKDFTSVNHETFADNTDSSDYKRIVPQNQNSKVVINSGEFTNIEELDAKILEHVEREGSKWKCNICNKVMRCQSYIKEHIEIHFDGLAFPCPDCGAIQRSRSSLRCHILRKHRLNLN